MSDKTITDIRPRIIRNQLPQKIDDILNDAFSEVLSGAKIEPKKNHLDRLIIDSQQQREAEYLYKYHILNENDIMIAVEGVDSIHPDKLNDYKNRYPDATVVINTHTIRIRETEILNHPNKRLLALQNPDFHLT